MSRTAALDCGATAPLFSEPLARAHICDARYNMCDERNAVLNQSLIDIINTASYTPQEGVFHLWGGLSILAPTAFPAALLRLSCSSPIHALLLPMGLRSRLGAQDDGDAREPVADVMVLNPPGDFQAVGRRERGSVVSVRDPAGLCDSRAGRYAAKSS